jgi:hypothetical protein
MFDFASADFPNLTFDRIIAPTPIKVPNTPTQQLNQRRESRFYKTFHLILNLRISNEFSNDDLLKTAGEELIAIILKKPFEGTAIDPFLRSENPFSRLENDRVQDNMILSPPTRVENHINQNTPFKAEVFKETEKFDKGPTYLGLSRLVKNNPKEIPITNPRLRASSMPEITSL